MTTKKPKPPKPLTVSEFASMGGKATAAARTPQERSDAARKASRAKYDKMSEADREAFREACRQRALASWEKRRKKS